MKVARITRTRVTLLSTWWDRQRPWSSHRIDTPIARFLLAFWWCSFCSTDECSGSVCRSSCWVDSCAVPRDGPLLGCLQFWKYLSNWCQSHAMALLPTYPESDQSIWCVFRILAGAVARVRIATGECRFCDRALTRTSRSIWLKPFTSNKGGMNSTNLILAIFSSLSSFPCAYKWWVGPSRRKGCSMVTGTPVETVNRDVPCCQLLKIKLDC